MDDLATIHAIYFLSKTYMVFHQRKAKCVIKNNVADAKKKIGMIERTKVSLGFIKFVILLNVYCLDIIFSF